MARIKEAEYKDLELLDFDNNPSGYTLRVYRLNKKSASCKIAKSGNFDPCSKNQRVEIVNDQLFFRNYFRPVKTDSLELKYERY